MKLEMIKHARVQPKSVRRWQCFQANISLRSPFIATPLGGQYYILHADYWGQEATEIRLYSYTKVGNILCLNY